MTAQEEKFSITVGEGRSSIIVPAKKFRHLALNGQSDRKLDKWVDLSGIRSLTVFKKPSECIASLICSSQMKTLRILDFSKASPRITQQDIRHIGELFHLRYLNLYKSSIRELPPWIGMLPFLQFLNLKKTKITSLPSEITQLERLQILRASSCSCNPSEGVLIPKGMENLADIEWLDIVDVNGSTDSATKALWKLTRLKHLGLTGLTQRNSEEVSEILTKLSPSLMYLYLGARRRNNGTLEYLPTKMASLQFPRLETIKLDGHIGKMPEWISHSLTLSVVKLYRTNLQQDDVDGLDRIRSLTTLSLLDSSYIGQQLFFYAGSFAALKRLDLVGLPNLLVVKFRETAIRRIRQLIVKSCTLRLFVRKDLLERLRVFRTDDSAVKVEETE
ncbi:disease resistance protein RPM1-like [Panicum virgatum]|uniref:disease resistance protein RPM1-like n=1 Tax=Panicum virgatum TaxID=38727 RepID=UPI0019D518D3|nr:disease resistance protein RPM1-like [Panicum virgatum]